MLFSCGLNLVVCIVYVVSLFVGLSSYYVECWLGLYVVGSICDLLCVFCMLLLSSSLRFGLWFALLYWLDIWVCMLGSWFGLWTEVFVWGCLLET